MTWEEIVKLYKIPLIYRDVCLEKCHINKKLIELMQKWLKTSYFNRPSLMLSGNTGCGKTYFAYALFRKIIESNYRDIRFIKSNELDKLLLTALLEKRDYYELQKFSEVGILFLDDLGTERTSERLISQYFDIIDYRVSNRLPTIYTSNLSLDDFHNPDKTNLGERIASRLSVCYEIKFPKKDLRRNMEIAI